MIVCAATLDVPWELAQFTARLLAAEPLTCFWQAVLGTPPVRGVPARREGTTRIRHTQGVVEHQLPATLTPGNTTLTVNDGPARPTLTVRLARRGQIPPKPCIEDLPMPES